MNEEDTIQAEALKTQRIANIISQATPGLRHCDCITIAKKLIELNIIKGFEDDIE